LNIDAGKLLTGFGMEIAA